MKAALTITKNKQLVNKVTFDSARFVIGRGHSCDLRIDEALVSKMHAEILLEKGVYQLRDCGSRNGTEVNARKIESPYRLKNGDVITLGDTELTFHSEPEGEDATRAASLSGLGGRAVPGKKAGRKGEPEIQVGLRIIEGPYAGGQFENWEGELKIGRALNNDVVLLDDNVSTEHARIIVDGGDFYIEDIDSLNGTFLNGVKVQKEKLKSGDKIKAGLSVLSFKRVDPAEVRRQLYRTLAVVSSVALIILVWQLFKPRDYAGEHVSAAIHELALRHLDAADKEVKEALAIKPNHPDAKKLSRRISELIDADKKMEQARNSARQGDYNRAREFCRQALTDDANNKDAQDLLAVIKRVEQAEVAIRGKNWGDAAHLLEDAQGTYAASPIIGERKKYVNDQLTSEKSLAEAKRLLQEGQLDTAEVLLRNITNGVYEPESKRLLTKIGQDRQLAAAMTGARSLYNKGQLPEAFDALTQVLPLAPNNMELKNLHDQVGKLLHLQEAMGKVLSLNQDSGVEDLLAGRRACLEIENAETDPLNAVVIQAKRLRASINEWLASRSHADGEQAERLCQIASSLQDLVAKHPKNAQEALQLFDEALKADSSNTATVEAASKLREEVLRKCRDYDAQAQGYDEDLHEPVNAKKQYQKIIELSSPGEHYYEKAQVWISRHP